MKVTSRLVGLVLGVVVAGTTLSGIAWANGDDFFDTGGEPPVLYYFGQIKDTNNNVLDGVVVTVKVKDLGMSFPVRNDSPGHYRSPDIGRAIKGMGKFVIDPSQIEITVSKAGYRQVQPSTSAAPSRAEGSVHVVFVMERAAAAAPAKK